MKSKLLSLVLATLISLLVFNALVTFSITPSSILTSDNIKYLPKDMELTLTFFIPPKDLNQLLYIAQQVSNNQIPPLTPQELASKFSQQDKVNKLLDFLVSNGFKILYQSPFAIVASANVDKVEQLFNTKLGLYNLTGKVFYKPIIPPRVNQDIFNGIIVGGLDNSTSFKPLNLRLSSNGTFQFSAISLTPNDIRLAYNVTGNGGKGVRIGIIVAYGDPLIFEDVKLFDKAYGLPPTNLSLYPVGPYRPEYGLITGWAIETALDVQAAHSMAPYAKIVLVVASDAGATLFAAVDAVVTQKLADVVSMSWGLPENLFGASGFYAFYKGISIPNYPYLDYYFALGAAEGITFFAASGDYGAYGTVPLLYGSAIFPATSPFVTAVGGTSLFVLKGKGYGYETAWSVLPQYFGVPVGTVSSGGGLSSFFPIPWYQQGVINSSTRAIPDVSAVGNPYTGLEIIYLGNKEVVGGTSLSSPLWAGMIANVISTTNKSIGLLNPILYWIYNNKTWYQRAFHQITFGFNGEYYANEGYNLVTGIGSPNVGELTSAIKWYYNNVKQLRISITTSGKEPWYMYGDKVTIISYITYPNGSVVTQGSFNAYIYTTKGLLAEVPLTFNGSHWVGYYQIKKDDPPNVWSIVVNGTSAGFNGVSSYNIVVGESINITNPVPYPYGLPLSPNKYFTVEAMVYYPNGTPAENEKVMAYLVKDGKIVSRTLLSPSPVEPGLFRGSMVLKNAQGGVYLLIVNSSYGSAYTYVYFGNVIVGAIFTPVISGFPSASVGQNITIVAFTASPFLDGIFSANVTAYIYKDGKLVAELPLVRAPNKVLYGVFNLFYGYYNNFTIPSNFTPGFYIVKIKSYINTTDVGVTEGEFLTAFYVAPSSLKFNISFKPIAYQGETVRVFAKITYPNGSDVKYGIFNAIILPTVIEFASLAVAIQEAVPLTYNQSLGLWVGEYRIPSVLYSTPFYQGTPTYVLAGPWSVILAGVSADGYPLVSTTGYLNVLPYTYLGENLVITRQNASLLPLLYGNHLLSSVYIGNLKVINANISLDNVIIGNLTSINSYVTISNSKIQSIKAINSVLNIFSSVIENSETAISLINSNVTLNSVTIRQVLYAYNLTNSNVNLNGVTYIGIIKNLTVTPQPKVSERTLYITQDVNSITLKVYGNNLNVNQVMLNNIPVQYSIVNKTSSQITISIPFKSSNMPPGSYVLRIIVYDGLPHELNVTVYNLYPQIIMSNSLANISTSLGSDVSFYKNIATTAFIISVISIIAIVYLILRRR